MSAERLVKKVRAGYATPAQMQRLVERLRQEAERRHQFIRVTEAQPDETDETPSDLS